MPIVVAVEYDSKQNNAYCYLESAITSYIMLLKWSGGRWCYQVLFEFPASQFSKYMYHSLVLVDNYIYWTTDRSIMSGRLPSYEQRLLIQPAWNHLYSMALDRPNQLLYVAAFDYTDNALFACSLNMFSCNKLITTDFTLNYIYLNKGTLYVASMARSNLYRFEANGQAGSRNGLVQVGTLNDEIANLVVIDESLAIYSNQQTVKVVRNFNASRTANAHLIDPYALQYVFSYNKIFEFDGYPYTYQFPDYDKYLYRNNLYIFYLYVCGMAIENSLAFLPQMDLNSHFLYMDTCENRFLKDKTVYLIPLIAAASVAICVIAIGVLICYWRYHRLTGAKCRLPGRCQKIQPARKAPSQHAGASTSSGISSSDSTVSSVQAAPPRRNLSKKFGYISNSISKQANVNPKDKHFHQQNPPDALHLKIQNCKQNGKVLHIYFNTYIH